MQKRALRWSEGVCVLEGPDLIDAALASGAEFEGLYIDSGALAFEPWSSLARRAGDAGVRVFALERGVLDKVAESMTPQPALAAVRFDAPEVTSLDGSGLVLVLHDVRDPGNAGTIIRSADAAGVEAVIFTGQSVDPYNPKALRASAGSIFHLAVVVSAYDEALAHLRARGAKVWATSLDATRELRDVDLRGSNVVVIGNEAAGLDPATVAKCDDSFRIAMAGRSESLNAGVAASLIAFYSMWQRQGANEVVARPNLGGL
ncbi:MAG TPA: RNA methyltransferase [Acidimicrobiales bacterium]|nr:RNA methyltransferase [Acidimicrobiales bacterium]